MKLVDVIKYEGDNETFVWKSDIEVFNSNSFLIVPETQVAIIFKDGQASDPIGAGRHKRDSENIPFLSIFQRLPTDGVAPHSCQVYFINMIQQMAIKWGTDSQVQYMDPTYQVPLSIGASGEMSLQVTDPKKLLLNLVGAGYGLTREELVSYFRGIMMTKIKSYLAQIMSRPDVSIFDISSRMGEMSRVLLQRVGEDFVDYGLAVTKFVVTNIRLPEGDEAYERLRASRIEGTLGIMEEKTQQTKDLIHANTRAGETVIQAQAEAERRRIEGIDAVTDRMLDIAEIAAQNSAAGGFGGGMWPGMAGGTAGTIGAMLSAAVAPAQQGLPQGSRFTGIPGYRAGGPASLPVPTAGPGIPGLSGLKEEPGASLPGAPTVPQAQIGPGMPQVPSMPSPAGGAPAGPAPVQPQAAASAPAAAPSAPPQQGAASADDLGKQLMDLEMSHYRGAISDEEYTARKDELMRKASGIY